MFQNIDQFVMYVCPFKVEYPLIEGTIPVHIYMAKFGSPLPGVHLLYKLQTARAPRMEHAEHFGANGLSVHLLEVCEND